MNWNSQYPEMFQFASLHTWNNYIRVLFFYYYYISVIVLRVGLLKNTLPNQLALRKQKTKRKIKNVSNFAMAMSCKAPFQELADLFQQRLATPCLSWGGRYVTPLEKKCSERKKGESINSNKCLPFVSCLRGKWKEQKTIPFACKRNAKTVTFVVFHRNVGLEPYHKKTKLHLFLLHNSY